MTKTYSEKKEYLKQWRDNNRDKVRESNRKYILNNKAAVYQQQAEYRATPQGKKVNTLKNWRKIKLVCDDVDTLYDNYINAKCCDNCSVEFGRKGDGTNSWKCMDHCHKTGKFRNFLCNYCNILRG